MRSTTRRSVNEEMTMKTQSDVYNEIKKIIPAALWEKYSHLSFGEMADEAELECYASALIKAETEWWAAGS